jgi:hypothetical protein
MRTIHLIYKIPESRNPFFYRWNKYSLLSKKLSPSYRNGSYISWSNPIFAPFSITYYLYKYLSNKYRVKLYDLNERGICNLKKDDILLFHPKEDNSYWEKNKVWKIDEESIFWKTLVKYPNHPSFCIAPYNHGAHSDGFLNPIFENFTQNFIAICGEFWIKTWEESAYKNLIKSPLHVNMALDSASYPKRKNTLNPKGKRRFLYIGNTLPWKNTIQLEEIANYSPDFEGGYFSNGNIPNWHKEADFISLNNENIDRICSEYDFFLNTSTFDAQATTILEQMSIGMGVACTPQSGISYDSIIQLSTNDNNFNLNKIQLMQQMNEKEYFEMSEKNIQLIEKIHSWEVFCSKIESFIQSNT